MNIGLTTGFPRSGLVHARNDGSAAGFHRNNMLLRSVLLLFAAGYTLNAAGRGAPFPAEPSGKLAWEPPQSYSAARRLATQIDQQGLPAPGVIAAPTSKPSRAAKPEDYGFPVPAPAPPLPAGMDRFTPPLLGSPAGPAVAEFTHSARPDDTVTAAGPDFTPATRFRFYGQTTAQDAVTMDRTVSVADSNAASVILPAQLPAWSMYLLWPGRGGVYGKPVAVNRTDAWWIGCDRSLPGEFVSVYGRNLSHGNGTGASWIYIKPASTAAGQWITPVSVNPYQVSFKVPPLGAGDYQVWTHNGHGGQFGWSGPLTLTILARSAWAGQPGHVFSVKDYGAVGSGAVDETGAIQKALNAASAAAPSAIYFPAGTYRVDGMIELKNNVFWSGENRDTSIIEAGPGFAANVPSEWPALIYSDSDAINNIEFKNLTFDGNANLGRKSLFIFRHHDHVRLTLCRFNWKGAVGGFNIGSNPYLTVSHNEFIGDQVFLGASRQVVVQNNLFRLTDFANAAVISWGGSEVSVTNNRAQDYDPAAASLAGIGSGRFFVSQCHPDSNRDFYIGDNTTVNMAPPINMGDANQGEQILFEVGTSTMAASPTAATATSATFASDLPAATSQDAVIIKGRGAGQFRHVTARNGNTITVSPAWLVVPDGTSVIGVGPAQTRTVVYHNTLDVKGNYHYETASVAMNMYGNVSDVIFANNTVTRMVGGLAAEFSQVPDAKTPTPSAAYFNLVSDNSLDGAACGIGIYTNSLTQDAPGTLGHLGNTFRWNTLKNIVFHGIRVEADEKGFRGGDLDQNTFEHNTITNVPIGFRVGRPRVYLHNPINTVFSHIQLYKNTFTRGTAPFAESKVFDVSGSTTSTWLLGNDWKGFERH